LIEVVLSLSEGLQEVNHDLLFRQSSGYLLTFS
jgi:hypothetical protein